MKSIVVRMAIILAITTPSAGFAQSGGMFQTRPKKSPDMVKPPEKPYQEAAPDNKILVKTTITENTAWWGENCGTAGIYVAIVDTGSIPYGGGPSLYDGQVSYGDQTTKFNWIYNGHLTHEDGSKTVKFRGIFYVNNPYKAKELTLNYTIFDATGSIVLSKGCQ